MTEVFETKLRRVGNSLGVIIPNEIIVELGYSRGDVIPIAIPSLDVKNRNKQILALVGIDKRKRGFVREKRDRY
ncbi:MAG: hypothetical protein JSV49_06670 [Thermoplasmata archaeon]|nr:MAG: hypothetical protein JSV49_06670 [Thermoplasmata archaeon]